MEESANEAGGYVPCLSAELRMSVVLRMGYTEVCAIALLTFIDCDTIVI